MAPKSPDSPRDAAVKLLRVRSLSRAELAAKLEARHFAPPSIEDALAFVERCAYIDEAGIAQSMRLRAEKEGRSPAWLDSALKARGLESPACREEVAILRSRAQAVADRWVEARYGPPSSLDNAQAQRAYRALCRRGFDREQAIHAIGSGFTDESFPFESS